jgi:hypothetical protein
MENQNNKIEVSINGFSLPFSIGDSVRLRHDPENNIFTVEAIRVLSDGGHDLKLCRGLDQCYALPGELIGV